MNRLKNIQIIFEGLSAKQKYISTDFFFENILTGFSEAIQPLDIFQNKLFTEALHNYNNETKNINIIDHSFISLNEIKELLTHEIVSNFTIDIINSNFSENRKKKVLETINEIFLDKLSPINVKSKEATTNIHLFCGKLFHSLPLKEKIVFLTKISRKFNYSDRLILSFPLKANPFEIQEKQKLYIEQTKHFPKRTLDIISELLEINIDPTDFEDYSSYSPETGEQARYLISKAEQLYYSKVLKQDISFGNYEPIRLYSERYFGIKGIELLADQTFLAMEKSFHDKKDNILYSIWKKA